MAKLRPSSTRRSRSEWTTRAVVALLIAVLGYLSVAQSLAYVVKRNDLSLAHSLAPWDGRITARLARKLFVAEADRRTLEGAAQLARAAVKQDATAVPAVVTLGLYAQLRGDSVNARRLFGFAQQLTRRDYETQLWAVEDAVSRGDISDALRQYDVTLRISPEAPSLMYPVLATAISDPAIRKELSRTLARKPPWYATFIDFVAVKGSDARSVAALFQSLRRAGLPVQEAASQAVIKSLLGSDMIDEAWQYYASIRPNASRYSSRDPRFTANVIDPLPFDWAPMGSGGISTSIQRAAGGGLFDFSAPASVGGPLIEQVQVLPPGEYRIQGHSAGINQPAGSRPYWVLRCRDGREFGRVDVPNSGKSNGYFSGVFRLPSGCPVQALTLIARPSDEVTGLSGQMDRVELVAVR